MVRVMFVANWGAHRARDVAEVSASLAESLLAANMAVTVNETEVALAVTVNETEAEPLTDDDSAATADLSLEV